MRKAARISLLLAAVLAAAGLTLAVWPRRKIDPAALLPKRHYDVRILRDTWGVPHVFGRTDPDVAYGLAWAHAEDDFQTIQGAMLAARGRLATVLGREGAPNDYLVQLLRISDVVDAGYERDLRPETRALCEAYAEGINHYAALHPDEAIADLYPARGRDLIAGFVHKTPLFFGLDRVLRGLLEPAPSPGPPVTPTGSNTFAVAPRRSADGFTRLAINSHQPWAGPVAWYEAHLHSETGWDAVGGLFPGVPLILHGHNRNLGWAHTVNKPDLIDVYALEMNPAHPTQYKLDGAWRELEVRTAAIQVKVLGPLSWTAHREVLWSVYGPVVRGPRGVFAIRIAGYGDVRHIEQWYRMNKASRFDEWLEAMRMNALPMFNVGYADREGHIFYVYNARLPLRSEGYDWSGIVPGNTSRTLWTESLPFDRLPQVRDPPSGFVQNCNSSPFHTTVGDGNPEPSAYSPAFGIETRMTNRSLRALELLGADEQITREEFDQYKFDVTYAGASVIAARIGQLLAAPVPADPLTRQALDLLRGWDRAATADSRAAALAVMALAPADEAEADMPPTSVLDERVAAAARRLQTQFGRIDVPWHDVLRLRHGTLDIGLFGGPDLLHAVYGRPGSDGRIAGVAGDSYILLVEWDPEGRVSSRSIQPYGSATLDAHSRHYADQAPLFAACRLKPVWMDESEIRAHLEREYRPGERR
ncbi:MAG TPA: acylase [Vicinamibacteria bacterium]|nr:acylase [Vicinamibacteria bacterium]